MQRSNFKEITLESFQNYKYDQYYPYPSLEAAAWIKLYKNRLDKITNDSRNKVFTLINETCGETMIIGLECSKWDEDLFGFRIGKIINPYVPDITKEKYLVMQLELIIRFAKRINIKVLIARLNGDNLKFIHILENKGFRYYETIIWPISDLSTIKPKIKRIVLFDKDKDDLNDLIRIANNFQYHRGHFHCDVRFNKETVNTLYSKWILSAIENNQIITIIKGKGKIIGYFICDIDRELSKATGYKYGRLKSLAIDNSYRGKGYGKELFEGTIALLKENDCRFVDSGYSSKNHRSAKLHSQFGFSSVYEEVTLHYWL